MKRCMAYALGAVILLPLWEVSAQIIPVKTVPIAEGDQYTFLPSTNRGLANVSLALADSLFDPFTNPATGARVRRSYVFSSPSVYSLSRNRSSGSTLPVGAFVRGRSVFGAAGFAFQKLTPPRSDNGAVFALTSVLAPVPTTGPAHQNQYAFALAGTPEQGARPALGASVFWSRLAGVEGTELLYPQSQSVDQHADAVTLRAGILKSFSPKQSLEAVLVHNRFFAQHDVRYQEFIWDPVRRFPMERFYVDHNFERTHLWGLQLLHRQVLRDSNWTVGASVIANRTDRLTNPVLGLMNVGRDPGESSALNAGVGVARRSGNTTIAADAIYEPIWGRSSVLADDVRYRFSNGIVRVGARHEIIAENQDVRLQLQLGMQLRSVNHSERSWNEWLHTWGMSLRAREFDLNYQGRVQSGVNRPGVPGFVRGFAEPTALSIAPSFVTPQAVLVPVRVTTHHLSISVPIQ
jgi:hypothetical protein